MAALSVFREQVETPPVMCSEWRAILNTLRLIALECRIAAQTDLFEACALLSNKKVIVRDAFAHALLKCLRQAIHKKPIFYRPGSAGASFDEAWLMRALVAAKESDSDSFAFLIRSRVPVMYQRHIIFLVKGMSEQFTQV